MREDRFVKKMLSKAIVSFIFRKKINWDENQISYDEIEFRNLFSTKSIALLDAKTNFSNAFKIDMIYCAKGTFTMGTNVRDYNNPQKKVEIKRPFLLCEIEVTQELYESVMDYNPSKFQGKEDSNQRPVDSATWYDAIMFCNKLSVLLDKSPYYKIEVTEYFTYHKNKQNIKEAKVEILGGNGFRLPYEKEWEYAAKAGTNNRWSGTSDESRLEEYAWFGEEWDKGSTHPVATKKPNEWGLYDMTGNVYEWCYDRDNNNVHGIFKGGCYHSDDISILDSAYRSLYIRPSQINLNTGFRVAISI